VLYLSPRLVRSTLDSDERSLTSIEPTVKKIHVDFVLAWGEGLFIDPSISREACARLCIARKDEIQALLHFDFWRSDMESGDAHWRSFLSTCSWVNGWRTLEQDHVYHDGNCKPPVDQRPAPNMAYMDSLQDQDEFEVDGRWKRLQSYIRHLK
jgi:hypothetical protein